MPSGLVADYRSLLSQCEGIYRDFLSLRSSLSACDSDSEQGNLSMVEGLKLYSEMEQLKQKLKLIENPLLRCVPPPVCWSASLPSSRSLRPHRSVWSLKVRVRVSEEF